MSEYDVHVTEDGAAVEHHTNGRRVVRGKADRSSALYAQIPAAIHEAVKRECAENGITLANFVSASLLEMLVQRGQTISLEDGGFRVER